jgi:hypothetical protein
MTTLEIKRLDSLYTSNKPSKTYISSNYYKSPIKITNQNQSNRNSLSSSTLRNYEQDEDDAFVKEIPINIIKSPSLTNNITNSTISESSNQPKPLIDKQSSLNQIKTNTLANNTDSSSLSTIKNSILPIKLHSQTKSENLKNENKQYNNTAQASNLSNTILNTSNLANSYLSEDLTNVSASNSIGENATLRFNKYGFIQPNDSSNVLSANTLNKSKDDSLKISNLDLDNTSSSLNQQSNFSTNSLSQKEIIKDETLKDSNDAVITATNLKDYLQNTNVEEFAEKLTIEKIRSRELKWIKMLKNFNEWMRKDFKKIRSRCRKGIPQSMRSKAWMHLTGAFLLKQQKPNYYLECLNNIHNIDVNKYVEDIKKDLHRQFPGHEIFMKREGRQMLFNVLKAYAVHNKEVGYCQAQGPIAAVLLMHLPEEDSFWMLIRISDYYLKEYFKPGLEKVQIDGKAIFYLFKKENLNAYKLMKAQSIDPILYMTEWFMCIYARTLPWCTVLRVWDMFFCEGVKVLYRVGLYLMCSAFSDRSKLERCVQQGMYETLDLLKNLPVESLKEAQLVNESSMIKLNENDMSQAFYKSKKEFLKQSNEFNKFHKQNQFKALSSNKNLSV